MAKEVVGLVGIFNEHMLEAVHKVIPSDYALECVGSKEETEKLKHINYIITRLMNIDRDVIEAAPSLKLIQRWGTGYDKVDVAYATNKGIPVAIAAGVNAVSVSEHAVLLMLAVYRRIIEADRAVHNGEWAKEEVLDQAMVLNGKMVGLIGFGNIARLTAQKVVAFGAAVQYYDIVRSSIQDETALQAKYVPFDELLTTSDIISMHVPITKQTERLIDAKAIAQMKSTAVIINTARGRVVDEQALADALEQRRIRGVGLDTFSCEPIEARNRLLEFPNVVCTPHIAGMTSENDALFARHCMQNILDLCEGRGINSKDLVNPQYVEKI